MASPSPIRTAAGLAALAIAAALTDCTGPETGTIGDATTAAGQESAPAIAIDL
jgi:hypothetical protein